MGVHDDFFKLVYDMYDKSKNKKDLNELMHVRLNSIKADIRMLQNNTLTKEELNEICLLIDSFLITRKARLSAYTTIIADDDTDSVLLKEMIEKERKFKTISEKLRKIMIKYEIMELVK